ncbi:hypothetical protein D3C83_51830 [compost metagenome]
MLRIAEEVQEVDLLVRLVPLQRLENDLGREPLVHEERERGDVERQALGLARPIEEWPAQALQMIDGFYERAHGDDDTTIGRLELCG